MKPIEFPEHNTVIAKDQPPYIPLPAYVANGITISCWHLTRWERLKLLFTGRLWAFQLNFGHPLQPQKFQVDCPFEERRKSRKER